MGSYKIKFVNHILDNVHGYIGLTEVENEIEKTPIFQRLRRIKQLGLASWIFPGAEHNRYIHSLGVMHIIDQMAIRLEYSDEERQILRLAGMLHDIGHYPLSHIGEFAYKEAKSEKDVYNTKSYNPIKSSNEKVKNSIERMGKTKADFISDILMEPSGNDFHHEKIGVQVIKNSDEIREIITKHCGNFIDMEDIYAIITGDITRPDIIAKVQLLHSELDADRIDYLLRDATFSGASYGRFELGTIIKNLEVKKHSKYDVDIVGVSTKGIGSADQFLINRYLAYSQVIFHKHVAILGRMAKDTISYFLNEKNASFPDKMTLLDWIGKHEQTQDYYKFTDDWFIKEIFNDKNKYNFSQINAVVNKLREYKAFEIKNGSIPLSFSFKDENSLRDNLTNSEIYKNLCKDLENSIYVLESVSVTKHVELEEFKKAYEEYKKLYQPNESEGGTPQLDLEECLKHRLINGVAVIGYDSDPVLLIDTKCSLIRGLSRHKHVFFNQYDII